MVVLNIAVWPKIVYFSATPQAVKTGQSFKLVCRASGYPQPALANYTIHKVAAGSKSLPLKPVPGGVMATVDEASASDHKYQCRVNMNWGNNSLVAHENINVVVYSKCVVYVSLLST